MNRGMRFFNMQKSARVHRSTLGINLVSFLRAFPRSSSPLPPPYIYTKRDPFRTKARASIIFRALAPGKNTKQP